MVKAEYDLQCNTVIVEFSGIVTPAEAEAAFPKLEKLVPEHGKGFRVLTDMSAVKEMCPEVRETIKKTMDLFDARGVTEIIRVVVDPVQDIGFNIMSLFHYSPRVKFITVESRKEAEALFTCARHKAANRS